MFSNGAEFEGWQEAWCRTCAKDREENCAIILRGLLHEPTPEWGRGPFYSPQTVVYCTEYTWVGIERTPPAVAEIAGQTSIHDFTEPLDVRRAEYDGP